MQNFLRKKLLIISGFFFVELVILGVLFILKNQNYINELYYLDIIIFTFSIFMLINLIVVFTCFAQISKSKVKSDVQAIDIIGKDTNDIYEFGGIGLIIVDDNNKIVWTNEWTPNSQGLLIDKEIYTVFPDLVKEKENPTGNTITEINGKKYQASYKKEANLFILKDVDNFQALSKYQIDFSPAVGIISIDNYLDLSGAYDELELSDMLSLVQKNIVEYAKKFNVYLRKFRADSYLAICTLESYKKMEADNFSIIQKVKEVSAKKDNNIDFNMITISIGFAVGFDDYNKLSEMAASSLDLALSRGGDQVVVIPYGKNYTFYGGRTDAKTKRNQSRARILSQSLTAVISSSENVFIMGHTNADLDAIGSSLGFYSLTKTYNEKVKVVYDEDFVETKTKLAVRKTFTKEQMDEIFITPQEALKQAKVNSSLLILTDVHRPSMCISKDLVSKINKIAVIDHHRKTADESVSKPIFSMIEPSASSASELVVELIRYNQKRIEVPSSIATMLLAGIILDTNHFRNKIGPITYAAALELKNYNADNTIADSFLKEDYNEYILKTRIMANHKL